jgi:hypothetical protein
MRRARGSWQIFTCGFSDGPVDASGLSFYTELLRGGQTQEVVIALIVSNPEYFTHAGAVAGTFTVLGSHTYAAAGGVRVAVTVGKEGVIPANGTRSITVADARSRHLAERSTGSHYSWRDSRRMSSGIRSTRSTSTRCCLRCRHAGRKAGATALHRTLDYSQKLVGDLFMRFLDARRANRTSGFSCPLFTTAPSV